MKLLPRGGRRVAGRIGHIFQNVPRLTVQRPADGLQGGETHRFGVVVFQNGQIGQGEVHFLGQLTEAHFPLGHHHIQVDNNGHGSTSLNRQVVLFLQLCRLTEEGRHNQTQKAAHKEHRHKEGVVGEQGGEASVVEEPP